MRPLVAITIGLVAWAAILVGLWVWADTDDPERTPVVQTETPRQARYTSASELPHDPAPHPSDAPQKRPAPVHLAGADGLEQLVADAFPEDPETAMRIVSCESGWNPEARSATGDTGLFQINDVHRRLGGYAEGLTIEELMDPATNVAVARRLYDAQGWHPWVCY